MFVLLVHRWSKRYLMECDCFAIFNPYVHKTNDITSCVFWMLRMIFYVLFFGCSVASKEISSEVVEDPIVADADGDGEDRTVRSEGVVCVCRERGGEKRGKRA